ncbi:TIGR02757 family protein [Pendulispora brunnea]|uniref:TIGR02757 family protein n=1 Tax=Pendulispora brunnea TaxID=2905690 RepID=A0ABZ2JWT0_9BACT
MKVGDEELRAALDAVRARADLAARRASDPVGVVHRYEDPLDRELVGLVAASVAFGNVKTILAKLGDLLDRVGPSPWRAADGDPAALKARLRGWKHRVFIGDDLARLLLGARAVQRAHGTLGQYFAALLQQHGDIRLALAAFCDAIRDVGKLRSRTRRGPAHLLPDPRGSSGVKRLLLYLRWMVRPADGIDLGLWPVEPSHLLMPVDTHIHKLSRNLGLTRQERLTWRATEEITASLARLDAGDPTKYDFSLCHMGMLQRCPSRRDSARCNGCGVMPVCRHWR